MDKKVIINGVEYGLNSSNKGLLEILPTQRYNPATQQKEDVYYMPVGTVFDLLNGLFPGWSYSEEYLTSGKTYKVQKSKRVDGKKQAYEDEIEVRSMRAKLIINGIEHTCVRESAVSSNIITSDDALSGADSKLSARCLKALCKRLGKVFQVGAEEDDAAKADIAESLTTEVKVIGTTGDSNQEQSFPEIDKIYNEERFKIGLDIIKREDVLIILKKIKKDLNIKTDSPEHKYIKKLLENFEKLPLSSNKTE